MQTGLTGKTIFLFYFIFTSSYFGADNPKIITTNISFPWAFKRYVLAKSHGQAEQGSYLVAHSCAARFVYLSASHFCSVKNGTLQFWNGILLYIGLYVAKFVFSLRLVPLPLVTNWRRKSVRR